MYNSLKNHVIEGGAIDVWYNYQPQEDENGRKYPWDNQYPFHELENLILSPHRGASPMNDLERWDDILYNIVQLAKSNMNFKNIVNLNLGY